MNPLVTLFADIHSTSTPFHRELSLILDRIKTGNSKELVEAIRNEGDKSVRQELKKKLPSVCFSGTFSKRASNALIDHSGLICLDFDGFKSKKVMNEFKKALTEDEYTYSVFVSPSGLGLKVLTRIPAEVENHKSFFSALEEYHSCDEFDKSTKDVSRACYESYDPKIFINPNASVWTEMSVKEEIEVDRTKKVDVVVINDDDNKVQKLIAWWEKNRDFKDGGRNNELFVLAAAFNQYGVPQSTALYVCMQFEQKDFTRDEIKTTVDSAYRNVADFNTKAMEDRDVMDQIRRDLKSGASKKEVKEELIEKGIDEKEAKAIVERANETAHEHIQVFWKKSDKGVVSMVHNLFREFLQDNGFYKYYPEGSNNFIFVRRVSNRVFNTTEQTLKDFVLNYIRTKVKDMKVWDFFADKTRFFKEDFLSLLPEIDINFVEDTDKESYLFYRNVAIRVTPTDIERIEYEDLPGWVWEDQMIDRDFNICDSSKCEFRQFISNISDSDTERIKSMRSTIGFLLHSYKPHNYCPAVILNDEVISGNPEGGTGKGIFATAIGHLRKSVSIDGKGFNFDRTFAYQTVQQDTQVLVFDDVRASFNFERLFSVITEGITLEKKNKDAIKIDFEKSPKIIITTNYAIKGSGNSFERRKWELEFKQFYTKDFTPREEFQHDLFTGWDDDEWCYFDNYMVSNLQLYLEKGFIKSKFVNLRARKFIAETNMEFYEWMTDPNNAYRTEERYHVQDLLNKFVLEYPDYDRKSKYALPNRKFKEYLIKYGEFKYGTATESNRDALGVWIMFKEPKVEQEKLKI